MKIGPSLASHCIAQSLLQARNAKFLCWNLRKCLLRECQFLEIPKITFFNSQSSTQPITPHKSMYPMVSYFITNLPVSIFTSQNMNLIRPATPEIKYVQKFNWIDGHGVEGEISDSTKVVVFLLAHLIYCMDIEPHLHSVAFVVLS